jgi:tryptophanyl-tRNA synthetase
MKNTKKRVLAGIRATGTLHLGNYLGAVKGMLELQNDANYETLYMVADVHTLTTPFDVEKLRANRREVVMDYLAAGLDPAKSVLFMQADVPEHTELAFYLSSVVSIARMQHLPTYKDKVKQHPHNNTMALLNYPILMTADILNYKAHFVPAGIDQEPHLEVAREIARKMNEQYGTDFPEPQRFVTSGQYVPSLTGEGKMSKSVEGSYINLTDDLAAIRQHLASAPTDSGKGKQLPSAGGVTNLLQLVNLIQGEKQRQVYEQMYLGGGIKYQELKESLAQAIYEQLKPIQAKRDELVADTKLVDAVIADGAKRARTIARATVDEVKEKLGLL